MMVSRKGFALVVVAVLAAGAVRADVKLPAVLGDHMVLQRQMPVKVWGWADPGEAVTVKLAGQEVSATACEKGKWSVTLQPMEAGGPYAMAVIGKNTLTLQDVLVGEVWIASGQSNMEFPVAGSVNAQQEIAQADYPQIRLFTVPKKIAESPTTECDSRWQACTPQSVPGFSAVAYFFGRQIHKELGVPVGLINSSWGGTPAESWMTAEALQSDEDFKPIVERAAAFDPKNPHQGTNLYDGMLYPVVPFTLRGALWYQGESNAGRAAQYRKLFPALIADWRKQWGEGDFPFLFVQLAPYRYGGADPRMLPEQWESQTEALSLPNVGMAVTTDIGDIKDIHPKNKQEVGRRLALWALAKTYGKDCVFSGPLFDAMEIRDGKATLSFRYAEGGLVAKGGDPTHFEIAGADGVYKPAQAKIEGEKLVVSSSEVAEPKAVRFAWSDTAEPNLFNQAGLPASPFRTDKSEMITAGNK